MNAAPVNAPTCTVANCHRDAHAKGLCAGHYFRLRRNSTATAPIRSRQYRDRLPRGYHADAPIGGAGLYGSVITCETCGDQLGPVHNPASAAMAIHSHQLRAHHPTGRHLKP